jgi:hypothetical protein
MDGDNSKAQAQTHLTFPCPKMNNALKIGFPPFLNEPSLRSAIESVCAKFGKVSYLKIHPTSRGQGRKCLCYLRLDSAAAEKELQSKFQLFRSPKDLYAFVDVDEKYGLSDSLSPATIAGGRFAHFGWRISGIRSYLESHRRAT